MIKRQGNKGTNLSCSLCYLVFLCSFPLINLFFQPLIESTNSCKFLKNLQELAGV